MICSVVTLQSPDPHPVHVHVCLALMSEGWAQVDEVQLLPHVAAFFKWPNKRSQSFSHGEEAKTLSSGLQEPESFNQETISTGKNNIFVDGLAGCNLQSE